MSGATVADAGGRLQQTKAGELAKTQAYQRRPDGVDDRQRCVVRSERRTPQGVDGRLGQHRRQGAVGGVDQAREQRALDLGTVALLAKMRTQLARLATQDFVGIFGSSDQHDAAPDTQGAVLARWRGARPRQRVM
jgi:hypothetical protein